MKQIKTKNAKSIINHICTHSWKLPGWINFSESLHAPRVKMITLLIVQYVYPSLA